MAGEFRMSPASLALVPRITPPSTASGTRQVKPRRDASMVSVRASSGAAQVTRKQKVFPASWE